MKKLPLLLIFFLTACVTINIYFPAAAADEAADKLIKDIQKVTPSASEKPQASLPHWKLTVYQWVDEGLNIIISPVQADEADLSIDSTEIRRVQASMKARFDTLKDFYEQGYVGITKEGLIAVKEASSIPLKSRNKVSKLVEAENTDRDTLYHAIADENGHPDWYQQIKTTFAKRWVSNAQAGWWYQNANEKWTKK
ncbi:MAG: YdbL family protein [Methylococcales bacterium]|nr:YdbL family protein [Methylococcales bacterium]